LNYVHFKLHIIYIASSNSSFSLLLSINSGTIRSTISVSIKCISQILLTIQKNIYYNWLPGKVGIGIVQADSGSVCSEIFGWGRTIGLVQSLAIVAGEKLFNGPKCGSDRAHM
jgi:hypothetical protein